MSDYIIRRGEYRDLQRLAEIYNQAILKKEYTGDTRPFSAEERTEWFREHSGVRFPLYVYERCGMVSGYAYLSPYRPGREALKYVCEVSYYIGFEYHRQGIGSVLLKFMIDEARNLGFLNIIAIVLDCNTGSKALLKKFGFREWGCLAKVAVIENNEYSHLYYGLRIAEHGLIK